MNQHASKFLLVVFAAVSATSLFSACGSSRISSTDLSTPGKKAESFSFKGRWDVSSRFCGGSPHPTPVNSWLQVDDSEAFFNYVTVTEDDENHICFHADGFRFTLQGFEKTNSLIVHRGHLQQTGLRDVCYTLKDGVQIEPPYKDEKKMIKNEEGTGAALFYDGNLSFKTNHRAFCGGAASEIHLKRE
jgi:hypothetical protein